MSAWHWLLLLVAARHQCSEGKEASSEEVPPDGRPASCRGLGRRAHPPPHGDQDAEPGSLALPCMETGIDCCFSGVTSGAPRFLSPNTPPPGSLWHPNPTAGSLPRRGPGVTRIVLSDLPLHVLFLLLQPVMPWSFQPRYDTVSRKSPRCSPNPGHPGISALYTHVLSAGLLIELKYKTSNPLTQRPERV